MTSALTRLTENMAPREWGLEDVWLVFCVCSLESRGGLASESSVCLMDTFLFAVLYDCFCVVEFSIDMVFNYSLNHNG
jgi:hypothetical protein